jgi:hypothetical protein
MDARGSPNRDDAGVGEDTMERLWLDVLELDATLTVARRHATQTFELSIDDLTTLDAVVALRTRHRQLTATQPSDPEREWLDALDQLIELREGQVDVCRLAVASATGSPGDNSSGLR